MNDTRRMVYINVKNQVIENSAKVKCDALCHNRSGQRGRAEDPGFQKEGVQIIYILSTECVVFMCT